MLIGLAHLHLEILGTQGNPAIAHRYNQEYALHVKVFIDKP